MCYGTSLARCCIQEVDRCGPDSVSVCYCFVSSILEILLHFWYRDVIMFMNQQDPLFFHDDSRTLLYYQLTSWIHKIVLAFSSDGFHPVLRKMSMSWRSKVARFTRGKLCQPMMMKGDWDWQRYRITCHWQLFKRHNIAQCVAVERPELHQILTFYICFVFTCLWHQNDRMCC